MRAEETISYLMEKEERFSSRKAAISFIFFGIVLRWENGGMVDPRKPGHLSGREWIISRFPNRRDLIKEKVTPDVWHRISWLSKYSFIKNLPENLPEDWAKLLPEAIEIGLEDFKDPNDVMFLLYLSERINV